MQHRKVFKIISMFLGLYIALNAASSSAENAAESSAKSYNNYAHCSIEKNSQSNSTQPSGRLTFETFLNAFHVGADGLSTLRYSCQGTEADANTEAGDFSTSSLGGLQFSDAYDGVKKNQTLSVKGAIGINLELPSPTQNPWIISPYYSVNDSAQKNGPISNAGNNSIPISDYSEKQRKYGIASRFCAYIPYVNNNHPLCDRLHKNYIYYNIYDASDDIIKSQQHGINFRYVPVMQIGKYTLLNSDAYVGLNQYNTGTTDQSGNPIFSESEKGFIDSISRISRGLICDLRLDVSRFDVPGLSPTPKYPVVFIPNRDYVRAGGRIGAFASWGQNDKTSGLSAVTASVYYMDFTALYGRHADFGETVAQVSIPIYTKAAIAISYANGRNENFAEREESLSLSVKFTG